MASLEEPQVYSSFDGFDPSLKNFTENINEIYQLYVLNLFMKYTSGGLFLCGSSS